MAINSVPNLKSVVSATTTAPPGSPNTTDWYLVPSGATGAWSGQANKLTRYNGSSWDFITPHKDTLVWAADTRKLYIYNSIGSSFDNYTPNMSTFNLTVKEVDGTPNVSNVTEIRVSNGTLTDNTGGAVTITTGGGGGGGGISTTSDTSANTPSAGNNGNLFFPNDGAVIQRDNGSAWKDWGVVYNLTAPRIANFTWINQGSATSNEKNGFLSMTMPTSAGENVRLLKKTLAASSNYTVICGLIPNLRGLNYKNCGIMLRESSSGKLIGLSIALTGGTRPEARVYYWNNATTYAGDGPSLATYYPLREVFFKITDDATNRKYFIGNTPYDFVEIGSTTRTTHCTPDEVGIYINQAATDISGCGATFIQFQES